MNAAQQTSFEAVKANTHVDASADEAQMKFFLNPDERNQALVRFFITASIIFTSDFTPGYSSTRTPLPKTIFNSPCNSASGAYSLPCGPIH
jgi:hypothetical protein